MVLAQLKEENGLPTNFDNLMVERRPDSDSEDEEFTDTQRDKLSSMQSSYAEKEMQFKMAVTTAYD